MLPLLLAIGLARADDTPVLVSSFQPASDDDEAVASLIEAYLVDQLAGMEGVDLRRVEDMPAFDDYTARIYLQGCPPGEIVGCTAVVADRGGARFAVTGTVGGGDGDGVVVDLAVLDLDTDRVAVSFRTEMARGDDRAFAEAVARVLGAAVRGEIARDRDIRDLGDDEAPPADDAELRRQLAELEVEFGAVVASGALERGEGRIVRPAYTVADLAQRAEGEGMKPWERLRMTPAAYLRYKNSGLSLEAWRARAVGRQGALLVRAGLGWQNGPVDSAYYGAYAVDGSLATVDQWGAFAVQTGPGVGASAFVGWGLLPELAVGLSGGVSNGHMRVEVAQVQVGEIPEPTAPRDYGQATGFVGLRADAAFFPVSRVRPTVGGGVDLVVGQTTTAKVQLPPDVPVFPAPTLVALAASVGGEVTLSPRADLFLSVPLSFLMGGETLQTARSGTQPVVDAVEPDQAGVLGAGVLAGFQVRFLGKDTRSTGPLDDFDEP